MNPVSDEAVAFLDEAFVELKRIHQQRRAAADLARPALARLVAICGGKTGQSYKLRALLYSLWNGQPASLLEVVALDWAIREDLLSVVRGFGFEGLACEPFFYDAISNAFKKANLFDWFIQEERSNDA